MSADMWNDLVVPGVPILEKVVRTTVVYVFLVVGLRLAGKRELGQLNPFDLVVLLTLSNTVQNAIIGNDNSMAGGIVGAATLLALNALVVHWMYRHPRIERLVEGRPQVLVQNGQLRPDRLAREYITVEELESAARRQGFATLDEVDRAVLEPGGSLTFAAHKAHPRRARHHEILARLDAISDELKAIRASAPSA